MIGVAITMALFALQLMTSEDVIRIAKQLVKNIDDSDLTGTAKKDYVMKELQKFFRNIVPIILSSIIEIAVLDLQNENGVLQNKMKDMKNG